MPYFFLKDNSIKKRSSLLASQRQKTTKDFLSLFNEMDFRSKVNSPSSFSAGGLQATKTAF